MAWRSAGRTQAAQSRRRDTPIGPRLDPVPGPAGGPPETRTIGAGRRRALPAGRALVGGFLVAVAAVIVFAAALAGASNTGQHWVVAAHPVSAGAILGPGDLTSATMRLSGGTEALAFRQSASVEGRALAVGLQAGELIQTPMLVPSSQAPALRPVSLAVDPVSLTGLSPGQPIDVLATQGTGTGATVVVVIRGATLLDVVASSSNLLTPGGSGQVTIGVATLSEVESVVAAAHAGTITLVAAERSDGTGPGAGS